MAMIKKASKLMNHYIHRLFKQPSNGHEAIRQIDLLLESIEISKERVCKTVGEIEAITNGGNNGKAIHSD